MQDRRPAATSGASLSRVPVMSILTEDYAQAVASFNLEAALAGFFDDGSVNAATICCDRHASDPRRLALRHRNPSGVTHDWTFADLKRRSAQFAHVLQARGVGKGDVVASLLPRSAELLIAILASWRLGAVYQPLFTAFGPKAIEHRIEIAGTRIVVTDAANRPKLDALAQRPEVITVDAGDAGGEESFWSELSAQVDIFEPIDCNPDDPFIIMFTSGTTGLPKPLLVPLRAIAAFAAYVRDAVGVEESDRFWNIADPGWAYGLYFGIVGPLALGTTIVFHEGNFTVESAYATIAEYGVTNLAGSPTAYRLLMSEGAEAAALIKGQLRAVSSAGEPLEPEVIRWFAQALNVSIYDHYGQTEVGMVVCNHHRLTHPVRIGSAGYAVPGHRAAILSPTGEELGVGTPGELALDVKQSPMMWFNGYHGRATPALANGYFRTGDIAELNDDGSISFVGRTDDVITTSGYRVGPFDVESALLEHEAVVESAVIGKPDPQRTEIIKAFVVLKPDVNGNEELVEALRLHVRSRLSAHAYPREIEFVAELPKTPSGKVQRFVLRNQEAAKAVADNIRSSS